MEKRYRDYLESPIERYESLKEEIDAMVNINNAAENRKIGKEEGRKEEAAILAVNMLQKRIGLLSQETVGLIYSSNLDKIHELCYSIFTIESEQDAIDILTVIN